MKRVMMTAVSAAALFGAFALATPAEAKIVLTGDAELTLEAGTPAADGRNQLFGALYGISAGTKLTGWVFGDNKAGDFEPGSLKLEGGRHNLTFEYLGSEATFNNKFFYGGTELKATGGGKNEVFPSGVDIGLASNVLDGVIDFAFKAFQGTTLKGFGKNGGGSADFCTDCSIFVLFLDAAGNPSTPSAKGTKEGFIVDIFFDDGGTNDNHDDIAIRMTATVVPVPAALPIIGAALAGFGFAGWRSRRSNG